MLKALEHYWQQPCNADLKQDITDHSEAIPVQGSRACMKKLGLNLRMYMIAHADL